MHKDFYKKSGVGNIRTISQVIMANDNFYQKQQEQIFSDCDDDDGGIWAS